MWLMRLAGDKNSKHRILSQDLQFYSLAYVYCSKMLASFGLHSVRLSGGMRKLLNWTGVTFVCDFWNLKFGILPATRMFLRTISHELGGGPDCWCGGNFSITSELEPKAQSSLLSTVL